MAAILAGRRGGSSPTARRHLVDAGVPEQRIDVTDDGKVGRTGRPPLT